MTTYETAIEQAKRRNPKLTIEGVGLWSPALSHPDYATKFAAARERLSQSQNIQRISDWLSQFKKARTSQLSSHYLRHVAGDELGHVSNGELILAAIVAGFAVTPSGINANVGISTRDVKAYAKRMAVTT